MLEGIGAICRHERLIGELRGARAGPTIVCVGGMHGNEPAGVLALERLVTALAGDGLKRGRLIAVIGNMGALNKGRRFIEGDLNRLWWPGLADHPIEGAARIHEEWEKAQLLQTLRDPLCDSPEEHYVLDLHTTSSPSAPFAIAGCSERCRRFAEAFGLPIILGLEGALGNTLTDYFIDQGWTAVALEAGQHQEPDSIQVHESLLWTALSELDCVAVEPPHSVVQMQDRLVRCREALRPAVQVLYRHHVQPGDNFRMEDGFVNLQPIIRGQLLARDERGEITAPTTGLVLMPLYQSQGEDGFFIVRDISD